MQTAELAGSRSTVGRRWRRRAGVAALGIVMVVPAGCRAQVGPCTIVWGEPEIFQIISPNPGGGAAGGIADLILSLIPFPVCGDDQNSI